MTVRTYTKAHCNGKIIEAWEHFKNVKSIDEDKWNYILNFENGTTKRIEKDLLDSIDVEDI